MWGCDLFEVDGEGLEGEGWGGKLDCVWGEGWGFCDGDDWLVDGFGGGGWCLGGDGDVDERGVVVFVFVGFVVVKDNVSIGLIVW